MSVDRMVRVNELMKREIAGALFRIMNEKSFDLSAITITRVAVSSDLHTAHVAVSIRDHVPDRAHILAQLQRHRSEFQRVVGDAIKLKYTPRILFELDESIEQGDHVLQIISEIEGTLPKVEDVPAEEEETST
ncbi:MAG TPA: 30S ribosome-binding factor RbfA [Kiritimatiellia bacterium]|nr:30S ribosome-binding factor RbfA [Kiritimatiellia bacterium]